MHETILIDGHVHIYPIYDIQRLIDKSRDNFILTQRTSTNRDDAIKVWLLTERADCHFFEKALETDIKGYTFEKTAEPETLIIKDRSTHEPLIYVLAGRQIVTRDRLEICALATSYQQDNNALNTSETISAVNDAGGLAALNWAPGKWFGQRKNVVKELLDQYSPQELLISDTTMRPTVWSTPNLMAAALRRGFRMISGSDPLPFKGEEKRIAGYAFLISGQFDYDKPAASIRALLKDAQSEITICGKRSGPVTFLRRQLKIMAEK